MSRPHGTDTAFDIITILDALYQGHCFIEYNLPALIQVFNFNSHGLESAIQMGDELDHRNRIGFQIRY
jgi:hypothetical protein